MHHMRTLSHEQKRTPKNLQLLVWLNNLMFIPAVETSTAI